MTDARDFAAGFLAGWLSFLTVMVGAETVGGVTMAAVWFAAGIASLAVAVVMLLTVLKRHMARPESAPEDASWTVETAPHTAGTKTHPCGIRDEDPGPSGPMIAFPATSQQHR